MPEPALVVNVFLASPSELKEERDVVAQIVSNINMVRIKERIVITLRRWEDCPPDASEDGAQGVITDHLDIAGCDIFLGILWNKLGSPTARAESGTVEEFEIAFDSWQRKHSPRICLYFKEFTPGPTARLTKDQKRVRAFRQKVEEADRILHRVFKKEEGIAIFERIVRTHLNLQINRVLDTLAQTSGSDLIFGHGPKPMYLVSGGFVLNPLIDQSVRSDQRIEPEAGRHQLCDYPLHKPAFGIQKMFSASNLIGISEVRAWSYLLNTFDQPLAPRKLMGITDVDPKYRDERDLDFLSLGAYSNVRSKSVVQDENNELIVPGQFALPNGAWDARFVTKDSGEPIHEKSGEGWDYGLIMRVTPRHHPEQTWLFCGGLGEWGTSGSAYFLANRWHALAAELAQRKLHRKHFAALLAVDYGSDSSARILQVYSDRPSIKTFPPPDHVLLTRFDED